MEKTILTITGMTCANCVNTVTKALAKTDGVAEVNVNFATEKATVAFDEKKIDADNLISIVKDRGYGATVYDPGADLAKQQEGQRREIAKVRRLFIMSLFFAVPSFIISMVLMGLGIVIPYQGYILWLLATPVQFIVGARFYRGMWGALRNWSANMDTLVATGTSAAYLYSVWVLLFNPASHQYFETSTILITFVILGKYLEAAAKGRTSDAIKKLMELSPKIAAVVRDGAEVKIPIEQVRVGDHIIVRPGESVPVDGAIVRGESAVDESMITGESIPVDKTAGDIVIGGTMNKSGAFTFVAGKVGGDTTLARIIRLIEDAQTAKAPIQRFADVVSAWFVPFVIGTAILTFLVWYFVVGREFAFALMAAIAVLVISCPCALGLATPTAIMVGTGRGAREGILIKGGDVLETVHKLKYIVFDKTGTITTGKPSVTDIIPVDSQSEADVLSLAASLEINSEHPLAEPIVALAKERGLRTVGVTDFAAVAGAGVTGKIDGKTYRLGNAGLMEQQRVNLSAVAERISTLQREGKTAMVLARGGRVQGIVAVADTIKETAPAAVATLKRMGIETYLITGDNEATAAAIAGQAGIDHVFAGVLPADKAAHVKELQKKGTVGMVGDGINDAPALAQADIGIAMRSGTDVAMEAGNIVIMKDELADIPRSIQLSKATMAKIRQNMFWALIYNTVGIPIAALGLLNPIIAGGAMAMSSVSVVTNSLLLKFKKL
ncbi:MAG: heavy metal translocating P-type ATPase [Deltaproteobacteria bacterium]|nr:heavy metal translocating P-type ATPase [Candidatus Zymogenaceae bacterium]